jgi:hypothetical protein
MELYDPTANIKVADINTVPADFRPMYKQEADGFVFDAENPVVKSAMSVIGTLKKTNGVIRSERDAATKNKIDFSPLADYGQTPTEVVAAFLAQKAELEAQIKNVNIDDIKKGVGKEFEKKLVLREKREAQLQKQLQKTLVKNGCAAALAAQKGNIKLLLPYMEGQVQLVEENEEFHARVVDDAGKVRFGANGHMTLDELAAEFKANAEFGACFASEAPAGGGTKPGTTNQVPAPRNTAAATMTAEEKIRMGLLKKG